MTSEAVIVEIVEIVEVLTHVANETMSKLGAETIQSVRQLQTLNE